LTGSSVLYLGVADLDRMAFFRDREGKLLALSSREATKS